MVGFIHQKNKPRTRLNFGPEDTGPGPVNHRAYAASRTVIRPEPIGGGLRQFGAPA